ncbi:upstream activation factor subunit spp27 isoform X7 [Neodiprion virginianus]|uniref:upstream activation factor subunit spp27 isoform X7 n=1 Tax=Neodiprion fabricii TaxID=2872261 RepID=UPI001ED8F486|nr:upstream activation factor subunit spp27 isoform X7 [Neodiprion fabricii]XP_046612852.1 upstream activation factor subunit spp27 isoform X7 [Neodiprion virginianus]
MADISKDELRKEITAILKDADLTTMSAKKVRQQIEEKLDVDLTDRKKEVDDLVMECLQEKQDSGKKNKKGKAASEESEEGEEEEEEGSEEEEEEEEKKPAKRTPAKKTVTKRKKGSSDDEESASDDDASDEEYSPKKPKPTPKKGKPGKKGKKKGSDSDSDEDWGKSKKAAGGAKKGAGKGKGGGYTRAVTLSPELASVVGAEQMARHEVVKKVWSIIKERNLYDPKNKQFAICDEELLKVIGVKRFRTFGMMKYLKNHFVD